MILLYVMLVVSVLMHQSRKAICVQMELHVHDGSNGIVSLSLVNKIPWCEYNFS